jgi:hypothetical protein
VPLVSGVAKVKLPLDGIGRSSPPLTSSTRPEPARPLTVPPSVNWRVTQLTAMLLTLPATVPEPLAIVHC